MLKSAYLDSGSCFLILSHFSVDSSLSSDLCVEDFDFDLNLRFGGVWLNSEELLSNTESVSELDLILSFVSFKTDFDCFLKLLSNDF